MKSMLQMYIWATSSCAICALVFYKIHLSKLTNDLLIYVSIHLMNLPVFKDVIQIT